VAEVRVEACIMFKAMTNEKSTSDRRYFKNIIMTDKTESIHK